MAEDLRESTLAAEELRGSALYYHRFPRPGKLAIQATKPLASKRDLALAYSPGVAEAFWRSRGTPVRRPPSLPAAIWLR